MNRTQNRCSDCLTEIKIGETFFQDYTILPLCFSCYFVRLARTSLEVLTKQGKRSEYEEK